MAYAFEKLPQLVNLRGKLPHDGWYEVLPETRKTDIAIHHSLTKTGNSRAFANYHVGTHGWPEVAYHFVILRDGTIEYNHQLGVKSYHVGNSNDIAVGICLVGDFRDSEPTEAQKKSLYELHPLIVKELPNYKRTRGHDEFPGYSWKSCPEFDYKSVLKGDFDPMAKGYLKRGDKGESVEKMQLRLKKAGYSLKVDGVFGPNTEKTLRKFQRNEKIEVDGLYGPQTQKTLDEVLDRKVEASSKPAEQPKPPKSEDEVNVAETGFKDVKAGAYYADAIKWAVDNEIVFGKGGTGYTEFGVGEPMKREDVIVVLHRMYKNLHGK